ELGQVDDDERHRLPEDQVEEDRRVAEQREVDARSLGDTACKGRLRRARLAPERRAGKLPGKLAREVAEVREARQVVAGAREAAEAADRVVDEAPELRVRHPRTAAGQHEI